MNFFYKPDINPEQIRAWVNRQCPYLSEEDANKKVQAEINKKKAEARKYNQLAMANLIFLLAGVGFGIAAIVSVFMSKWSFFVGFGLLAYIAIFIFRRIPWPKTETEKLFDSLRQYRQYR